MTYYVQLKKKYVREEIKLDFSTIKGYMRSLYKLQPLLQMGPNDFVLDLGCGIGNLDFALLEYTCNIIGIDISIINLLKAKKLIKKIDFILADAENLPIKDSCFSKIFAFGILEHLPDPISSLKEVYRTLKSKGLLIMYQTYRLDDYSVMWHRLLSSLHLTKSRICSLEIQHINQFNPEVWIFFSFKIWPQSNLQDSIICASYNPLLLSF